MQTLVIIGTGLIGASFGLAVKKAKLFRNIIGVSSVSAAAKNLGAIDSAQSLKEAVPQADMILLAQPIRRILSTITQLDGLAEPHALVTDVGSTKQSICEHAEKHLSGPLFIGGHPMAGKEQRGPEAASADLFQGRPWILTQDHPPLTAIIQAIGARPVFLDPAQHDAIVALSSHLPQLLSTSLATYLAHDELAQTEVPNVAGPGILDMTRLALSSFELWDDILATNHSNIAVALEGMIGQLIALRQELGTNAIANNFKDASDFATKLRR
jgi:prephenate dehydrogenase